MNTTNERNKRIEWIAAISSLIGCMAIAAPMFVETDYDLANIGVGIIGISLSIYLIFGNKESEIN